MALPVRVRSLVKKFGTTVAVAGVDLDIPAGALFFLLGPSGCGKTTILRMLAGFTDPTSGAIHFGDREVTHLAPNHRQTGMVFQSYALWPHMTVEQNVAFGLTVRRVPKDQSRQRVREALEAVQMAEYALRKPNELSGGQQQRVALARALVIKPDLLLLDEPLSNLDAKLRLEMRGMIRRVCVQAGLTAVYVTHDQKEALSMADGVAVLRAGCVMQVGPPRHLYDRPASRFVADFLGETNFVAAAVIGHEADAVILDTPAGRWRARVAPPDLQPGQSVTCSIRPEAIRLLREGDLHDRAILNSFAARRLDSVYLGETAQHQLAIHDTIVLKALELNPRPIEEPASDGATVRIGVHPRDVVVLAE